jgi:hypothetical protein
MGRVRRGGYIFIWWKGDHVPSHVKLDTMEPMDATRIDRRILAIIRDLRKEGRL